MNVTNDLWLVGCADLLESLSGNGGQVLRKIVGPSLDNCHIDLDGPVPLLPFLNETKAPTKYIDNHVIVLKRGR